MGQSQSRAIDGLGHESPLSTLPQPQSKEKANQLILALISTFRFNTVAEELVCAYFMGDSPKQLIDLFDQEAEQLPKWPQDDPVEDSVWEENMAEFANQDQYQERFFDFFRDELTEIPNWIDVVRKFESLVFDGLWERDCRALVHLACAAEIDHAMMAMEGLAMAAWATPENAKEVEAKGDLKITIERALCTGGLALPITAAACQLILAKKHLLTPQRLLNRLSYEIDQLWEQGGSSTTRAEPKTRQEIRASIVLDACLREL